MAGKFAYRDPATNILKAWGYVSANAPGDLVQAVADDFALEVGKWQWNGVAWVPFVPPPVPANPLIAKIDAALASPQVPQPLKDLFATWKTQL